MKSWISLSDQISRLLIAAPDRGWFEPPVLPSRRRWEIAPIPVRQFFQPGASFRHHLNRSVSPGGAGRSDVQARPFRWHAQRRLLGRPVDWMAARLYLARRIGSDT